MSASETLLAALAKAVRELPDEKLVEVAAPWIAETFAAAIDATPAVAATPVLAPKKAAARPLAKPAHVASRRRGGAVGKTMAPKTSGINANVELVFKAIVGCDGAISRPEIIAKTKLSDAAVGYALSRLKRQERAFIAGHSKHARWAITQEAADEAVGG